jgi:hypothetical protein
MVIFWRPKVAKVAGNSRVIAIRLLILVALGFTGYKFMVMQFRPMKSLPFWHQPVVVDNGHSWLFYGSVTKSVHWAGNTYLVTPWYWLYDMQVLSPSDTDKFVSRRIPDKGAGKPKPVNVAYINGRFSQPTVSAIGESSVLINVHYESEPPHVTLYNLKSHAYTRVDGALTGRGNYLSPAYAVITKSGVVMLNQPGKPPRQLYKMPMSSATLANFVTTCDNRDGSMWDYDPSNDRLAYSTSAGVVTMVTGGKARTWHIPGIVGIHYVYLEPGTHYVWLCEGMFPVNWCLVVYRDDGKPLGRSVQGAGVMPWFQPITQHEYRVIRETILRSHLKLESNW